MSDKNVNASTGLAPSVEALLTEMIAQARRGHPRFCLGIHHHEDGHTEEEWEDWGVTFRRLILAVNEPAGIAPEIHSPTVATTAPTDEEVERALDAFYSPSDEAKRRYGVEPDWDFSAEKRHTKDRIRLAGVLTDFLRGRSGADTEGRGGSAVGYEAGRESLRRLVAYASHRPMCEFRPLSYGGSMGCTCGLDDLYTRAIQKVEQLPDEARRALGAHTPDLHSRATAETRDADV